jgi:hypothetical protein
MTRLPDWMLRLEALVDARSHQRFEWGVFDCSMWACDVVLAVTGRDPAVGLRGEYSSEEDAAALIEAGGSLRSMAAARFGVEIDPRSAAVGDVGLIATDRGPALVACMGSHWLSAGAWGLVVVDAADVEQAWRCEVI